MGEDPSGIAGFILLSVWATTAPGVTLATS
jgi:hypothetical protein